MAACSRQSLFSQREMRYSKNSRPHGAFTPAPTPGLVHYNNHKDCSMSRVVFLEERCKGCQLCAMVCPKKIIHQSSRFNRQGYKVVEVTDMNSCTGCASCALICPDCAIRVFRSKKGGGA